MNIQGPKKPPTPVQFQAQQQIRGQQPYPQQGIVQAIFRPAGSGQPNEFDFHRQQQFAAVAQQQQNQQQQQRFHIAPTNLQRQANPPTQQQSQHFSQSQLSQHQAAFQQQLHQQQQAAGQHLPFRPNLQQPQAPPKQQGPTGQQQFPPLPSPANFPQQQQSASRPIAIPQPSQQQVRPSLQPTPPLQPQVLPVSSVTYATAAAPIPSGPPHDIGKANQLAPATLQQQHTQQPLAQTPPNQQSIAAQPSSAGRQPSPVMYQQASQQQRGPASYSAIPRQQVPGGMATRQPRPTMSSPGPNTMGYPGGTMFIPGQPPHFVPGQPQVITLQGPPAQTTMQYSTSMQAPRMPTPQYPITTQVGTQPQQYNPQAPAFQVMQQQPYQPVPQPIPPQPQAAPTGEKLIRQPTNTVYYTRDFNSPQGAPGGAAAPGQQPGQPGMAPMTQRAPAPVAAQLPYQKRARKGLQIVDPNTMKDISEEIYKGEGMPEKSSTPPQDSQNSDDAAKSSPSPVDPQQNSTSNQEATPDPDQAAIQQEFAERVTALAIDKPSVAAAVADQQKQSPSPSPDSVEGTVSPAMESNKSMSGSSSNAVSKESTPAPVEISQDITPAPATESPSSSSKPIVTEPDVVPEVEVMAESPPPPQEPVSQEPVREIIQEMSPKPDIVPTVREPSPVIVRQEKLEESQNRKKKGKHKTYNAKDTNGSDMDAFVDVPTQAATAEVNNVDAATAAAAAKPPTPSTSAQASHEPSPIPEVHVQQPTPPAPTKPQPEPEPEPVKEATPPPPPPAEVEAEPVAPPVQQQQAPVVEPQPLPKEATPEPTPPPQVNHQEAVEEPDIVEVEIKDIEVEKKNEKNASDAASNQDLVNHVDICDSSEMVNNKDRTSEDKVSSTKESKEQNNREEKEQDLSDSSSSNPSVIQEEKVEPALTLKYQYSEDQWSPLNPEGKKWYDRHFLLNMQYAVESKAKPPGLPNLPDIILDQPIMKQTPGGGGSGSGQHAGGMGSRAISMPDFTPGYIKQLNKPPVGKRGSQQKHGRGPGGPGGSQHGEARKIIHIPTIGVEVKLHQTDNAWKLTAQVDKKATPDEAKTQDIYKRVTGILNKLTPQKFQTLVTQVLDLSIDTEERLKGSIDIIFEKAISEPNFSVAYANMCKCMTVLKVPKAQKDPASKDPEEIVLFRNLLLNKCQKEFERDRAEDLDYAEKLKEIECQEKEEDKKTMLAELDMAKWRGKRRTLGNIRFIGELFKLKMLTEKIMHDCLVRLLKSHDEESLECLCRLLTTIGKDIDHHKAKQRVDTYFAQLDKIVKNKSTSSRVRFMIQDVIELRKNKWIPRRDDSNPKTIEQIHKEAQKEEVERTQLIARLHQEQKHIPQPQRGPHRGGRGSQQGQTGPVGEDGWTSVSGKATKIDPSKMKFTHAAKVSDDNIQLGPGGPGGRPGAFGTWGRGSSGGSGAGGRSSSQEQERPSTPGNRFSALNQEPQDGRGRASMGGRNMPPPSRGDSRENRAPRLSGQRPPAGGARAAARSSMEHDREAALQAARNMGKPPRNAGSRNQSRENSRGRDDSRENKRPPPGMQQPVSSTSQSADKPTGKELSVDEIERKTKSTLDEYLHLHDLNEAIACVKELDSSRSMHLFVSTALNHVLEKTKQSRQMTGTLLHDLVKKKIIAVDQYLTGLNEVLEFAEDMVIDIPKIWTYLGEMIGPMVHDGSVPLNFLKSACEVLKPTNRAGVLVAEVLHDAAHRLGHIEVGEQWKASGLQWPDFLSSSQDIDEFLRQNKLEFTMGPEEPLSPVGKGLSPAQIQSELDRLIIRDRVDNSDVFDWVEANVGKANTKQPAFIRALMTSVCSGAIDDKGSGSANVASPRLETRKDLLRRYLDTNDNLELQALYALQALVHKKEHPPGVLRTFFDTLYDEDIISEDAFNQWDSSAEPAEMAGKGVARSSVEQFFTWLREAEEEATEGH